MGSSRKNVVIRDFSNDSELVTIEVLGNIDDGFEDDYVDDAIPFVDEEIIADEVAVLDAIPISERSSS